MRTGYNHVEYNLEELFFKNFIDLQIYGHEHDYERTLPIYDYHFEDPGDLNVYRDPKYPVHIITGAGGCEKVKDSFVVPQPKWSGFRKNVYGFIYLKPIDRMTLTITFHSINDEKNIDQLTITKTADIPMFNREFLTGD